MKREMQGALRLPAVALLLALGGCAGGGLGGLGNILGGLGLPGSQGQAGQIAGEVQQVDTRAQQISVLTQSGQTGWVRYDNQTQVIYQQQQYAVTSLERGDVVQMQVQQDQSGNLYTSQIYVTQSVQERGGAGGAVSGSGQLQQFSGTVGQVDQPRGWFELRSQYGSYTVTLPYNPGPATQDYFNRLRTGSSVRIEGTLLTRDRIELYRFY